MRLLLLLCLINVVLSCNTAFFVSKDRVVYTEHGFILFSDDGDFFIPSSIDTTMNVKDFFCSNGMYEKGFRLSLNLENRRKLLKESAEKLNYRQYIVAVELSYLKSIILPKGVRRKNSKYYTKHYLEGENVLVSFKVNNSENKIISVAPLR